VTALSCAPRWGMHVVQGFNREPSSNHASDTRERCSHNRSALRRGRHSHNRSGLAGEVLPGLQSTHGAVRLGCAVAGAACRPTRHPRLTPLTRPQHCMTRRSTMHRQPPREAGPLMRPRALQEFGVETQGAAPTSSGRPNWTLKFPANCGKASS